jgi:ABC-2 type transport system permease protein
VRFMVVLATEVMKLRRGKVPLLTLLAIALGPLGTGLFMWIALEPGRAADLGLLGTKAELGGIDASWAGYFDMTTQMVGIVGGLLLAIITAWVFAREYVEGTARNLLALPIPRWWFVAAKLVLVAGWWLGLAGFSARVLITGGGAVLLAALVGLLLAPVVAWLAILGRGYLPPLGFAMLMLVLGNVLGATGWGRWFPWSIVPLYAGVAGPRMETLAAGSLLVVGLTCAAGVAAAIAQLRWADHGG